MSDQDQQRLDELGERIEGARRDAEEDGLLPDEEQTLIDPDADGVEDPYRAQPPG